jgi:predicted molibdopterin-dependent oxidoreductase YjgC
VRALGLGGDAGRILLGAGTRGLVVFGDDPVRWDPSLGAALAKHAFVAAALTNAGATAAAVREAGGILLPLATHAEYAGSFTNFEGRVQRFAPALAARGAALPGYEIGLELAATLGKRGWDPASRPQDRLAEIWERLLPKGATLAAVDWRHLPQDAVVPAAQETAQPIPRGYTREEVAWRP